jgi:hypothetical protein
MHDLRDILFHLYNRHDERGSSMGGDLDQQSHVKGTMNYMGTNGRLYFAAPKIVRL